MAAKIRVIPAQAAAFEVPISYTATVGRTPENTVCLSFSPTVSRQHAIIRCHNGYEYQLMDLGSRNGTYVNEKRVVMPVTLQSGARIRIANNDLIFEQESDFEGGGEDAATLAGSMDPAQQTIHSAAILVCDIRGFSSQSEILPAAAVAQLLGQWFREAGNLIQKHGGVIDKFIGDAILAYWQENPGPPSESESAYWSARRLLDLADARRWPESGKPFAVGIAVHFGRVAFGNIGLVAQRDATIIGNAVNTAFRLESITKELGQHLLVSDDLLQALPVPDREQFVDLGEKSLKGKNEVVRVFGLKGS
jgi:adenylate cyclase